MHVEPVHIQRNRVLAVLRPECFQIDDEVIGVDGLLVDFEQVDSLLFGDGGDDGTIACVDVFLVDGQIGVLGAPFASEETPLREIDLVEVEKKLVVGFGFGKLAQRLTAVISVVRSYNIGLGLLLADFLALDAVFEVKSAEGGDGDPFVGVYAMKTDCTLVESEAAPLFEGALVEEEVEMFLVEGVHSLLVRRWCGRVEGFAANVFDFGVGEVEGSCDASEGNKLARGSGGLGSAIAE